MRFRKVSKKGEHWMLGTLQPLLWKAPDSVGPEDYQYELGLILRMLNVTQAIEFYKTPEPILVMLCCPLGNLLNLNDIG